MAVFGRAGSGQKAELMSGFGCGYCKAGKAVGFGFIAFNCILAFGIAVSVSATWA